MRSTLNKTLSVAGVAGVLAAPASLAIAASNQTINTPTTDHAATASAVRKAAKKRYIARTLKAARLVAREQGRRSVRPGYRAALRTFTLRQLHSEWREERRALRRLRAARRVPPILRAIAACESGGNPRAIGGGGAFRGKYQFTVGTWRAVGGKGDPARASEGEQDRRALALYKRSGTAPWPVCGRA